MLEKVLQIDGKEYVIVINDQRELSFTKTKLDLWGETLDYTGLEENTKNSVKVLHTIINTIIGMIAESGIHYMRFKSLNDKRTKIYIKLLDRIIETRKLPYTFHEYGGLFTITRS